MSDADAVIVAAGELCGALSPCAKAPRRNAVVEVIYHPLSGHMTVGEAKHGLFAQDVAATGSGEIQAKVDGPRLRALVATYPPTASLALAIKGNTLVIRHERSTVRLPLHNVPRQAFRTPRGHKGPVAPTPPVQMAGQPRGDTWDFSAQVPFSKPKGRT